MENTWDQFIVPPSEKQIPVLTEKDASEKAFYAASTSSDEPVKTYETVKTDLLLEGKSDFLDMANNAWKAEQDPKIKATVAEIIGDTTISSTDKKTILSTYALTGFLSNDLKDKYIQKTASNVVGNTVSDTEAQDAIISTLVSRQNKRLAQENIEKSTDFVDNLFDPITKENIRQSLIAGSVAIQDTLLAIPAGLGKVYSLLVDKDVEKAKQLQEKIKAWAFDSTEEGVNKKKEDILSFLAPLGAPSQLIYEKEKADLLKQGASPAKAELSAMAASVVEDPLNWIGLGVLAKQVNQILNLMFLLLLLLL